jgi:two-component system chemotaxis response regulator CheY
MMPRVDGLQTLAAIREKAPEVPVFMISALGDPRTVFDACYKGGATAYLVKPVRKEKLLAELRAFGLLPATGD